MKRTRADRICAVCRQPFAPTREDQRACGFRCARTLAGRTLKAKGTPAALTRQQQVNAAARQARIAQACVARFGTLSPREAALFAFGSANGYRCGYARGYHASRRSGGRKAGVA
jgi:hypothetical protein